MTQQIMLLLVLQQSIETSSIYWVTRTQILTRCFLYQIKGMNLRNTNIGDAIAWNLDDHQRFLVDPISATVLLLYSRKCTEKLLLLPISVLWFFKSSHLFFLIKYGFYGLTMWINVGLMMYMSDDGPFIT